MGKFIWCSSHAPMLEQVSELYSEWGMHPYLIILSDINPSLQDALNNCPDNYDELLQLAIELHEIARKENATIVQPGGSPAFQYVLGKVRMTKLLVTPVLYAHSERISVETAPNEDGSIEKLSVFKHLKFVQV